MKIIVCTHKQYSETHTEKEYLPLHVGAANASTSLPFQRDDTGENISAKNPNYCELTGLYWAWKNLKDEDYVGLSHYRRYFSETPQEMEAILKGGADIILPKLWHLPFSLRFDYCHHHIPEDFETLRSVVADLHPEYIDAFDRVFESNLLSPCNMFVMPTATMDRYCHWLFSILFEVEKRVTICPYPYQRRIFGFMSERLMQVFAEQNKLKVHRAKLINSESANPSALKTMAGDLVRDTLFCTTNWFFKRY